MPETPTTPLDEILSDDKGEKKGEAPEEAKAENEAPEKPSDTPDEQEKAAAPEDLEQADAQQSEAGEKEPDHVPLRTFLDVQNKLKNELEEAKAKLAEADAKAKEKPDFGEIFKPPELGDRPDAFENPEGFADHQAQTSRAETRQIVQQQSYIYAKRNFGEDKTDAALVAFADAMAKNPFLGQAAQASADPVGEIVNWHEKQVLLERISSAGGLEKYEESLREKWKTEGAKPVEAGDKPANTKTADTKKTNQADETLPTQDFGEGGAMPKDKPFNIKPLEEVFDT